MKKIILNDLSFEMIVQKMLYVSQKSWRTALKGMALIYTQIPPSHIYPYKMKKSSWDVILSLITISLTLKR